MQRRNFLKHTPAVCLVPGVLAVLMQSCKTAAVFVVDTTQAGFIKVPITAFSEGKQRLSLRDKRLEYDVLLIKKGEGSYKALYMKCTHEESAVVASSTSIFCNQHGSQFDMDGNVMKDPALLPLKIFPTTIENDFVIIKTS